MTSKRRAPTKSDAPITGVAEGNLGTAANLDDTQVMRTEDLRAAAAAATGQPLEAPQEPARAVEAARRAPRQAPERRIARRAPGKNVLATAGAVAVVVLLLIAGSGFLSQLDFGTATGPGFSFGGATAAPFATTAPESPSVKQGGGGGPGGVGHGPKLCHGHGHGNGCEGAGD